MDLDATAGPLLKDDVLGLVVQCPLDAHPQVSGILPRNLPAEFPEGVGDGLMIGTAREVLDGVDHGVGWRMLIRRSLPPPVGWSRRRTGGAVTRGQT